MKRLMLALLLLPTLAFGLTAPQMATLKAAIQADSANALRTDAEIAEWANTQASPAYYVWKSSITSEELRSALVIGAIQLDNLTAGKRDTLIFLASGAVDPSLATTRAALDDLCGTQATLKTAIQAIEKRTATRAEKALATGAGTSAAPSTLGWEGVLSAQDVIDALTQG